MFVEFRFRIAAVYSNNDNKLGRTSTKFFLNRGPANDETPFFPPNLTHAEPASPTSIRIHWEVLMNMICFFYLSAHPYISGKALLYLYIPVCGDCSINDIAILCMLYTSDFHKSFSDKFLCVRKSSAVVQLNCYYCKKSLFI